MFLDATHLGSTFPDRFPTVFAAAADAGIDPRVEPLPVSPAAHYHMGGIAVDHTGRTSLDGLYAVGETAATGLHGANRLASNSLLEGLVFGARVAAEARAQPAIARASASVVVPESALEVAGDDDDAAVAELRDTMWRNAGVVRTADGLEQARRSIAATSVALRTGPAARNLASVASVVIQTALARTESRGGHFRADYPATDPGWRHHTRYRPSPERTTTIASSRRVVA